MRKLLIGIAILYGLSLGQETGARYLVITYDNFYDAVMPLAQWKQKKGVRTKVVKLSAIGSTSYAIKNYIVNAYNNWQIRPEYLLLVGAPNYLPFPQVSGVYTDNYYTNMDGDIYNEILSGRLTVHNTTEAQTVVAKMLMYERTPLITDSLWLRKAITIVNEEGDYNDTIYWHDAKHAAGLMVGAGYVEIDSLSDYRGDNYTTVISNTNLGRGFVLYRGSATNNWYMPFNVNPDNLANGNKLPIVISATCGTLGSGSTPATAERWFLTGTPSVLRGASGYFATTTSGYNLAYLRSAVACGFFDGVFVNKYRTFGQACENGRLRVYQTYGSASEYYGFTTVGDPEMNIRTAKPQPIVVVHDTLLFPDIFDTMSVQVFKQGAVVESAYVCIMFDTLLYQTAYTDINGTASFNFALPDTGYMYITVTGENLYPYEGQIPVRCNSPFLAYDHNTVNDSLGDNDGEVDAGETIILWATIHNVSPVTAPDVTAFLRTSDTLVNVSDSISIYGTIPGGNLSTGINPFVFNVSARNYDHPVNFNIIMMDADGDTWSGNFSIMTNSGEDGGGTGPDPYGYYIYDDTDTGSGNAPVYDWFEIAPPAGGSGGIISEITDEDADTVTVPLPFTFKFYGVDYNSFGISSNGILEMGNPTYDLDENGPIPRPGLAKRISAPFWDDLDPGTTGYGHGDIYQYHNSTDHIWIIEFYQVALGYGSYAWETFQIILRDPAYYPTPTGDGEFLYLYNTVSDVNGNTVGIEDETETRGLQYVFDGQYDVNAAAIQNSRALLVTTRPPVTGTHEPWLHLTGHATGDSLGGDGDGVLEPGEKIQLTLTVMNGGDTMAGGVTGTIRTASSSMTMLDSVAGFGDIEAGDVSSNLADPFRILIPIDPPDTVVGFVVHFTGNDGSYEAGGYFTLFIHGEYGIDESGMIGIGRTSLTVAPNPASDKITIRYMLPDARCAINSIKIFDATGRLVKSFDPESCIRNHASAVTWSGTDESGRKVPAGIYFVQLAADKTTLVRKAILLK